MSMRLALCAAFGLSLVACSNEDRIDLPSASARPRPTVPELAVPHVGVHDQAMSIDGRRTEPQWSRAAHIDAFVDPGSGGTPSGGGPRAQAWLFWDDDALFVSMSVQDAKVRGGFPKDAIDPHLWERDTIEIMLDPDGDGDNRDYYEIQINPQNLVFDSQFDGYNSPRTLPDGPFGNQDWRSELVSAVTIDGTLDDDGDTDGGYTVEAKLPWKSFQKAKSAPPRAGDVWRANFYAMEDNGGVAWSPILGQGNFHRASRFGRLVFSPKP